MKKFQLTSLNLGLVISLFILMAGCSIPFLPRLEIDSFPLNEELIETMEVKGVVYVRVNNPAAINDNGADPTLWVPASVYKSGKFVATKLNLPKTNNAVASISTTPSDESTKTAEGVGADYQNEITSTELTSNEDKLSEKPDAVLPLRRRALLFPTRVTTDRPDIATMLGLELEKKLPLLIQETQNLKLQEKGRLLYQPNEITIAIKEWLKKGAIPAPVQFVLFLTTSSGRNCQFYTCTWIDAQTGSNVATFTFRTNLLGKLMLPLVPTRPTPLLRLIDSTSWWCRIKSRPADKRYILEAGHRSNLKYGHELQVFAQAVSITDPKNKNRLGFLFSKPLGTVTVTDFFAADGSLAQPRTPLSANFEKAWAVEIVTIPDEEITKKEQPLTRD